MPIDGRGLPCLIAQALIQTFQKLKISHEPKVLHPKYYTILQETALHSHLGRQKMNWFQADQFLHQVKPKILNNIATYISILTS